MRRQEIELEEASVEGFSGFLKEIRRNCEGR